MKHLLASAVLIVFQATSVFAAGTCRVIEYAELKDTSSENLVKTYCRNQKLVQLERDYLEKTREIYQDTPLTATGKKTLEEHSQELHQCLDTQMKIRSALGNRSESVEPSCD